MSLKPLNDVALIKVERNQHSVGGLNLVSSEQKQGVENGILLELPDLPYLGFHSFAFEDSLVNADKLKELVDYYSNLVGKRVYWIALADRGAVLADSNDSFAMIKLTDFIGWSEPDELYTTDIGRTSI